MNDNIYIALLGAHTLTNHVHKYIYKKLTYDKYMLATPESAYS